MGIMYNSFEKNKSNDNFKKQFNNLKV